MLAAGLLAGCSSGSDEILDSTSPTPGGTNSSDTELMAIRLGNGGLTGETTLSRAPITPAEWIGTKVGIFALNKVTGAVWTDNSVNNTETDNLDCLLNGVQATIADNAVAGTNPQGVVFGETFYYPRVSNKNYSFYGYHPYVAPTEASLTVGESQIACSYVITGKEDIIWGKIAAAPATGTDGKQYDGYNAAYFRKIAPAPVSPNIPFKHLLTQLTFSLQRGADYDPTTCAMSEIKLTSVPKNGNLMIANAVVPADEGTVAWQSTIVTNGTVNLVPVPVATDLADVPAYTGPALTLAEGVNRLDIPNTAVMLPSGFQKYQLSVTLNGDPTTLTISPKTGNFLPGYAYNIALTINGPMAITINATLTDWKTGEEIVTEI